MDGTVRDQGSGIGIRGLGHVRDRGSPANAPSSTGQENCHQSWLEAVSRWPRGVGFRNCVPRCEPGLRFLPGGSMGALDVKSFRELTVWREAVELVVDCYRLAELLPSERTLRHRGADEAVRYVDSGEHCRRPWPEAAQGLLEPRSHRARFRSRAGDAPSRCRETRLLLDKSDERDFETAGACRPNAQPTRCCVEA